jgi:hypothetical protein
MTTMPVNQIEISTEDYNCQTACTSAGVSVGVTVKVTITAKPPTEQAAVEQAVRDLNSDDESHDGEACCKPEFDGYFGEELSKRTLGKPTGYSVSSVGSPEYSATDEKTSDAAPTPAPDAGGGGWGMIIGVVVAVVLVAVAAGFA